MYNIISTLMKYTSFSPPGQKEIAPCITTCRVDSEHDNRRTDSSAGNPGN